ncbi:MAG TPA: hypothetical protein VFB83_01695, partial [Propionibacteriaceae bacterium]|nr:hypothetical protein [Propionibacteriaceae bacterium]
ETRCEPRLEWLKASPGGMSRPTVRNLRYWIGPLLEDMVDRVRRHGYLIGWKAGRHGHQLTQRDRLSSAVRYFW